MFGYTVGPHLNAYKKDCVFAFSRRLRIQLLRFGPAWTRPHVRNTYFANSNNCESGKKIRIRIYCILAFKCGPPNHRGVISAGTFTYITTSQALGKVYEHVTMKNGEGPEFVAYLMALG